MVRLADPIQLYAELTTHVPQHDLHRVGGSAFYKFCKIAIKQDNVYELVMGKSVHFFFTIQFMRLLSRWNNDLKLLFGKIKKNNLIFKFWKLVYQHNLDLGKFCCLDNLYFSNKMPLVDQVYLLNQSCIYFYLVVSKNA